MTKTILALVLALPLAVAQEKPKEPAGKALTDAQFIKLQSVELAISAAQTAVAQSQAQCEAQPQTAQAKLQLQAAQQRGQQVVEEIQRECGGTLRFGGDRPVCVGTAAQAPPKAPAKSESKK